MSESLFIRSKSCLVSLASPWSASPLITKAHAAHAQTRQHDDVSPLPSLQQIYSEPSTETPCTRTEHVTMAEPTSETTFMTLPAEIRLRVLHSVFVESSLRICGFKFKSGHHNNDRPERGKHISTRPTDYRPAHVCRKLRAEALPVLLKKTILTCCHMGSRLVDSDLHQAYRDHFRTLAIDTQSFGGKYIQSLRPDVLHRRCRELPALPRLRTLIISTRPCLRLPKGFKREKLHSTQRLTNGHTIFKEARDHAKKRLLDGRNETLAKIVESQDRTFKVEIHSYLADFHVQRESGQKGVAAASYSPIWRARDLT